MSNYQFVGIVLLISFFGGLILSRLPRKALRNEGAFFVSNPFTFELIDEYVNFNISEVAEDEFKVEYIDEWSVGICFNLYGPLTDDKWESSIGLGFGKERKAAIRIFPSPEWFTSSRIGYATVHKTGRSEMFISLPHQIARDLLTELRSNPKQVASVGVKRNTGKEGKTTYGVYSLSLSPQWPH